MTHDIQRRIRHRAITPQSSSQGYALVTGIVFLIILTIVAVLALKGTGLELKTSANNAMSIQAFEAAEAPRTLVTQLIDVHIFNRGWPVAIGGTVADALFNYTIPSGLSIRKDNTTSPPSPYNWYTSTPQTSSSFTPLDVSTPDATYSLNVATASTSSFMLQATTAIKKLRIDINPGAGAAMNAGYEGLGKAAATGGGNMFFYIVASGQDPHNQAVDLTSSAYRYVIRN